MSNNMYDAPIPDVLWTDSEILDYVDRFLPKLPHIYVQLAHQVDSSQPDTANVERRSVVRFKR